MVHIIPRSEWRARPPKRRHLISTPTSKLFLHHSGPPVGSDHRGAGGVRAIQNYHMDTRGWSDIAYSFIVDRHTGDIYEGRGAGVAGGHTKGHNTTSHAICVMGNFDREKPADHLLGVLAELVAYGHARGWWPNRITGGHRDAAETSCPGDHLYARIADINSGGSMAHPLSDHESGGSPPSWGLDSWREYVNRGGSSNDQHGRVAKRVDIAYALNKTVYPDLGALVTAVNRAQERIDAALSRSSAALSRADRALTAASQAASNASGATSTALKATADAADAGARADEAHELAVEALNKSGGEGGTHSLLDHTEIQEASSGAQFTVSEAFGAPLQAGQVDTVASLTRAATDISPKVSRPAIVSTITAAALWLGSRYGLDLPVDATEEAIAAVIAAVAAVQALVGYWVRDEVTIDPSTDGDR